METWAFEHVNTTIALLVLDLIVAFESRDSGPEDIKEVDRYAPQPRVLASNIPDRARTMTGRVIADSSCWRVSRLDWSGLELPTSKQGIDEASVPCEDERLTSSVA